MFNLMRSMCLLEAGRFSEDHVFTEKDWSLEKEGTVYEKSKRRAEKAAWELVNNLPGIEYSVFLILRVRSIGKSGFRFSKSKSGFPNRTRNPKTDFTSEKSVLRVDFN